MDHTVHITYKTNSHPNSAMTNTQPFCKNNRAELSNHASKTPVFKVCFSADVLFFCFHGLYYLVFKEFSGVLTLYGVPVQPQPRDT